MAENNTYKASLLPPSEGNVGWSCPSNIALIKYWGKKDRQIPMNPSLSMTLQEARTKTRVDYNFVPGSKKESIHFMFEGEEAPEFARRIEGFIESIKAHLPVLESTRLAISSENTFPHSSGIASSASAMGALALCLVQIEEKITGNMEEELFSEKASFIARLGSGSASRSLYPNFVLWGKTTLWQGSSDEYALPVPGIHPTFLNTRDSILIVESGQKKVSSSAGHSLMDTNPFSKVRFKQARENLSRLKKVLEEGNWEAFIEIMEEEALSLHAMMLTGRPGYVLMQPGTLRIIERIREFRLDTNLHLGFTLDAGANVHLLYAEADADAVETFIQSDLAPYCEDERVIRDRMGSGPQNLGS